MSALALGPRPPDWPARLAAFVEAHRAMDFAWGSNDCAAFAAAWLHALHGIDVFLRLGVRYGSARGARRLLAGRGLAAWCEHALGAPLERPGLAQRGDLVLLPTGRGPALAVVVGEHAVAPGLRGLQFEPVSGALAAWSV